MEDGAVGEVQREEGGDFKPRGCNEYRPLIGQQGVCGAIGCKWRGAVPC